MRINVVIDQMLRDVCERAISRWDANLAITKAELFFGICDSDRIFGTKTAPVLP
jgi:hypothetical protein